MWSLDWFAASDTARGGKPIRRVGWSNKWIVYHRGLWWIRTNAGDARVVKATDFGRNELLARDWTDELETADICGATRPGNSKPPAYRDWGTPIMTPPPIAGYSS